MTEKKIKRWHIVTLAVIVLVFLGLKAYEFYWPTTTIELKEQKLTVLVANNDGHRFKGLGGRDSLGKYDGMLFIYDLPSRRGIVMRNMRFSIDVVWFNAGKVVDIAPNLPLEPGAGELELTRYYPREVADLILELPAGWAEQYGLKIGDRLKLSQ